MKSKILSILAMVLVSILAAGQVATITSFNPSSGPVGTVVTITGANFNAIAANNIIYFGAVKANVSAASETSLTTIVPSGATFQPLTVTVNGLTTTAKKPFTVTFGSGLSAFTTNSFDFPVGFESYGRPLGTMIEDFNLDGKPDIASLGSNTSAALIFQNTSSDGIISFAQYYFVGNTGSYPTEITASDIDGDGKKDILVANGSDNDILVFRNTSVDGILSFESNPQSFPVFMFCSHLAVGDLNNDGKPDIAVSTNNSGDIAILKNTGSIGSIAFENATGLTAGTQLQHLIIHDLNNDGKSEIAVVDRNFPNNFLCVFRNISTAGQVIDFAPAVTFATAGYFSLNDENNDDLFSGDLDGDDKPDIGVTNNIDNSISLFRNMSSGSNISFAPKMDLPASSSPVAINFTDLDGDGKPDISVANNFGYVCTVIKNNSTAASLLFGDKIEFTTGTSDQSSSIASADFNGDGKPDMAISNFDPYKPARRLLFTQAPR